MRQKPFVTGSSQNLSILQKNEDCAAQGSSQFFLIWMTNGKLRWSDANVSNANISFLDMQLVLRLVSTTISILVFYYRFLWQMAKPWTFQHKDGPGTSEPKRSGTNTNLNGFMPYMSFSQSRSYEKYEKVIIMKSSKRIRIPNNYCHSNCGPNKNYSVCEL